MTKQGLTSRVPPKVAGIRNPDLFHRIGSLLHTLRCIASYEDQLCTLMHDSGNTETISADLVQELRDLIEKMPSHEYTDDLHAVEEALGTIDHVVQKHARLPTKVSLSPSKAKRKASS